MHLKKAKFVVVVALIALASSPVLGDKAPLSQEQLEKEASHIFEGEVLSIESKTQTSKVERAFGLHQDLVYSIRLKVSSVSMGAKLQVGDEILIEAWKAKVRIPPMPGLQGHQPIPDKGDQIKIYVGSVNKNDEKENVYVPLLPNGMQTQDDNQLAPAVKRLEAFAAPQDPGLELQFETSRNWHGGPPKDLQRHEVAAIEELARKRGLKKIDRIYIYCEGAPHGPAFVGVEGDRTIDGRNVLCKVMKITLQRWAKEGAAPDNGDLALNDIWTTGPVRIDQQTLLQVGPSAFRACFVRLPRQKAKLAESLVSRLKMGNVDLSMACREKFKGAKTFSDIGESFDSIDFNQPQWIIDWGSEVWLQFAVKSTHLDQRRDMRGASCIVKLRTDFREAIIAEIIDGRNRQEWFEPRLSFRNFKDNSSPGVVATNNALVLPIDTQLQKTQLGLEIADGGQISFVAINVNRLWNDGELAAEETWRQLERELENKLTPKAVVLRYCSETFPQGEIARKINDQILNAIPKETSVIKSPARNESKDSWSKLVDLAKAFKPQDRQQLEAPLGSETVVVYPVQTALSRILLGDTTWFVQLPCLSQKDGFLNENLRSEITSLFAKSGLTDGGNTLRFSIGSVKAEEGWEQVLAGQLKSLSHDLGFKTVSFTYTTEGVERLESVRLVGGKVPTFTLPTFSDSKNFEFGQATKGKVVLLNFFGFG